MKIKSVPVQFKAGPSDGLAEGEFIVYPSTFTKDPDSYGDIVHPGAFDDWLAEFKSSGNTLPGLYGHRMDDPDYAVASGEDMGVDSHGWWVKGSFDMESPKGPQTYRLVKTKRLTQLSFAYDTLDEGTVELADGRKANELRKLKVYEFSFVPIGANQDTSIVAIKSAERAVGAIVGQAEVLQEAAKEGRRVADGQIERLRSAGDAIKEFIAWAEKQDTETSPSDDGKDADPASAEQDASRPETAPDAAAQAAADGAKSGTAQALARLQLATTDLGVHA